MSRVYVRREGGQREALGALAISLGAAVVTFYVARLLLTREGLELEAPGREPPEREPGASSKGRE
jgi:hypothetical protein